MSDGKKVDKVVSGNVRTRKKTFSERISETVLSSDLSGLKNDIIFDVIIPAIKDMAYDAMHSLIDGIFYRGEKSSSRPRRSSGGMYYSYDEEYDKKARKKESILASTNRLDAIEFDRREDAEAVLRSMRGLIREFDVASVKDLYRYIGKATEYTHERWGWYDLESAYVERVRGKYVLRLPKPIIID